MNGKESSRDQQARKRRQERIVIRDLSPKEKRLAQVFKVLAAILSALYLLHLAWPR